MKNNKILKNQMNDQNYYVKLPSGKFAEIEKDCDPGSIVVKYPTERWTGISRKTIKLADCEHKKNIMRCVDAWKNTENQNHPCPNGTYKPFENWSESGRTNAYWISQEDIWFDALNIKDTQEGANEASVFYQDVTSNNGDIRKSIDAFKEKHAYKNTRGHKIPNELLNTFFEFEYHCSFILPAIPRNFKGEKDVQKYIWFPAQDGDNSLTPYNGEDAMQDISNLNYWKRNYEIRLGEALDGALDYEQPIPPVSFMREPITKLYCKEYFAIDE